ncbi:MAG: peroxiredoxin [Deltaproteobacteria bacterium]|nr:peroxiredoxin [Deltaproteobacteria bacterium]MBK9364905.1 peroxiredoxin [Deltaproteobacteria bacterium]
MSEITGIPRIGDAAPQFTAPSTHGEISLSQYAGKWIVLFSHPADFTPVCTTEIAQFARKQDVFDALNVQLIGLSIDSIYSHIAWARFIENELGVPVKFPLIADLSQQVAAKYGMLHPGVSNTATVRAVFLIDPNQVVRAMVYYPLTTGRSIDEIIRVVQALQLNAKHALATPEGWHPGDKCIVPPPLTLAGAAERVKSNYEVTDWFFSKTDCPQ